MLEEALGLGALFTVRGPVAPPADVVVIGISRESARALGQTTELDTWPRELHAQLVERLTAAGVTRHRLRPDVSRAPRRAGRRAASPRRSSGPATSCCSRRPATAMSSRSTARSTAWREQRTPPLASLKAAALGSAPFILPTVPVRVGQVVDVRSRDGRHAVAARSRFAGAPVAVLRGVRALARTRATRHDARVAADACGRAGAAQPRAHDGCDSRDAPERQRLARRRASRSSRASGYAAATVCALRALLDLYAGSNSRYLNFYGPARAIQTVPYDRALAGSSEIDLAGKVVLVGMSEPRQPRQQDDFYSVFSAKHRHQPERCRGRRDRCRQPPRATHAATVAAAASRCARRRCSASHSARSSAGSPMLRAAGVAVLGALRSTLQSRCGSSRATTSGCRWSYRCSCSCRSASVWRSGGTIARSPCSASASGPRSATTCRSPLRDG